MEKSARFVVVCNVSVVVMIVMIVGFVTASSSSSSLSDSSSCSSSSDRSCSQTETARGVRVVLIGASGATGSRLLEALIADPRVEVVSNLGRRVYTTLPTHAKFRQHVVDFDNLETSALKDDSLLHNYDVAFMTHGTTRALAGSAEAFVKIDHDYPIAFAKFCKSRLGVETFTAVTAMGADKDSWFLYPETKGKIEEDLKELKFKRLRIYRPGFLKREDSDRFLERLFDTLTPDSFKVDLGKLGKLMLDDTIASHEERKRNGDGSEPKVDVISIRSLS